jgi:hypothetical protein
MLPACTPVLGKIIWISAIKKLHIAYIYIYIYIYIYRTMELSFWIYWQTFRDITITSSVPKQKTNLENTV